MSDLTDRIAAAHRVDMVQQPSGAYRCTCGATPQSETAHIAEVTEVAVRERIAADIEAVDPVEWALAGDSAGVDAARIARGGDR